MNPVTEVGLFEAKTHLSELVRRVAAGEAFVITLRGVPVAELRPIGGRKPALRRGQAANPGFRMSADFDEPLDELGEYR